MRNVHVQRRVCTARYPGVVLQVTGQPPVSQPRRHVPWAVPLRHIGPRKRRGSHRDPIAAYGDIVTDRIPYGSSHR